jgi:hypothetical protein
MPYSIKKIKNKWYVFDNSNVQVPSHGFPTKEKAHKQMIAVILSESKKKNLPKSLFF